MKVRGYEVPINIQLELEPYLNHFRDYRIRGDKLQACSPFRYEKHPSFAVNLENGTWIDSGSPTDLYHKGNFISLLAYLRQEQYQDTEDYLLEAYNIQLAEIDNLKLNMNLVYEPVKEVTHNWLSDYKYLHYRHPYLARRGITEEVQRLFCIGYSKEHDAVAMPWFNTDKRVINIKYRSTKYKQFFYEPEGLLTRNYVYGLPQCISKGYKDVVIVESEIDCMYLWSNGIPAVAMGHAGINKVQVNLLLKAGITSVTIASDNDDAGNRFRADMEKKLPKLFTVYSLDIPYCYKDVNDIPQRELKELHKNRRKLKISFIKRG